MVMRDSFLRQGPARRRDRDKTLWWASRVRVDGDWQGAGRTPWGESDEEPSWGKVWHCLVGESLEALRVIRNQGNEEWGESPWGCSGLWCRGTGTWE